MAKHEIGDRFYAITNDTRFWTAFGGKKPNTRKEFCWLCLCEFSYFSVAIFRHESATYHKVRNEISNLRMDMDVLKLEGTKEGQARTIRFVNIRSVNIPNNGLSEGNFFKPFEKASAFVIYFMTAPHHHRASRTTSVIIRL